MTKKKKLLILIACECVLLFTMVTGTIAWLTHETQSITNTFTPSDINITLEETDATDSDADSLVDSWSQQMIPGATIDKKATVTVQNDVDCYVFVKVDKVNNLDTYITYKMATGWIALTDTNNDGVADDGVYYRAVGVDGDKSWSVLDGDKVTVNSSVTKDQMAALGTDAENYPMLTFTAYAIQSENLPYTEGANDAEKAQTAWTVLNNP